MAIHHSTPPSMQIVDHKIFEYRKGGYKTSVLAHKQVRLYVAMKNCKLSSSSLQHADPETWTDAATCRPPEEVNPARIYPGSHPSYTHFTPTKGQHREDFFLKSNEFLTLVGDVGVSNSRYRRAGEITAREITTCEALRLHPHPNIAAYHGVLTTTMLEYNHNGTLITVPLNKERVRSIVFTRYDASLSQLVKTRQPFDIRFCLNSIAAGIKHMHSLGFVHCDIKPANIFVKVAEGKRHHFVVGDFDSAHRTGVVRSLKAGDPKWTRPKKSGDTVEEADDWYAFSVLKKWLAREFGEKVEKYEGIGKRVSAQMARRRRRVC